MSTLSKFVGLTGVVAMMLIFNSMAFAQLPEGEHSKMGENWEARFNEIIKELNLSPEQQQAISLQRTQEKAKSQQLRQKMKSVRNEITLELDKEATDMIKVSSLVAQLKELTGNRIEQQIQGIMSLKKILTPLQFKALNEKRKHGDKRKQDKQ